MVTGALRSAYRTTVTFDGEARKMMQFAAAACPGTGGRRVLDVGCGFGRNLRLLKANGFEALGVDVNPKIVQDNVAAGLPSVTPEEFAQQQGVFDLVLMSHIVEHFTPSELVAFMDVYLDRLRPGGHLLIATPLASSNFYDDFDHVRPYQPIGLLMVFGGDEAQVQYYARNRIELRDIWFRRSPWRGSFLRARYINSAATRVLQTAELAAAVLFRASFGLIGRTDGWVGLFRKVSRSE
jgi:SAM-dependent methyltransferase